MVFKRSPRQPANYLDYTPRIDPTIPSTTDHEGIVHVTVARRGVVHRVAQRIWKVPATTTITLDALGSFVWLHIDGTRTIEEIAHAVEKHFGESANPLYERLTQYIRVLERNSFVTTSAPAPR